MRLQVVLRILGVLLMCFSVAQLPPLMVSWLYQDSAGVPFMIAFALTFGIGLLLWLPTRGISHELRMREGFVVVALFWGVLSAAGSLPFMLSAHLQMSFTDAFFESVSGLTTTGATVITRLEGLPNSILYYRQQLQWLGGMGIIVLAVAVLPMLGIGGMQLYRAETPGPMKDSKLTPRITETAKSLWLIYVLATVVCAFSYWLAGMTPFDALGHAFSTVALGGFSTHDASIGFYNSPKVHLVAIVFMYLAGINFALHFVALRGRTLREYWRDPEFRFYSTLLVVASLAVIGFLYYKGLYGGGQGIITGAFQVVSFATTSGFTTADFARWPEVVGFLLILASFMGPSAGSTGGGLKTMRVLLLIRQGGREVMRLIHPAAKVPIRLGSKTVLPRVNDAVWGFFSLYIACYTIMYLALAATGIDLITAFTAIAASMNNLGPGLGKVAANFAGINETGKWICSLAMLLGRLEIYPILVLLYPAFWKR